MVQSASGQSARMSKITNDGLTRSGTGCFIQLYPYGNTGYQRVNLGRSLRILGYRHNESMSPSVGWSFDGQGLIES